MSTVQTESQILWQKLEGLVIFAISTVAFYLAGGHFLLYIPLLLSFDVSMIGYLLGPRLGSFVYNLVHNYAVALLALSAFYWIDTSLLLQVGILWVAHVGMDRALGYGLKSAASFKETHLGKIGT